MRQAFQYFRSNIKIAEIGVFKGAHAKQLLDDMPDAQVYLIDAYDIRYSTFQPYGGGEFNPMEFIEAVTELIAPYGDRAKLLVQESIVAAHQFDDDYFDFVYIDAQHEYYHVKKDIAAWWPKVKKGGTLGGHDAGTPGVTHAIREFFPDSHLIRGADWMVQK